MPWAWRSLTSCFSSRWGARGPAPLAQAGSGAKKARGALPQGPSPQHMAGVSITAVAPMAWRCFSRSPTPRNLPAEVPWCQVRLPWAGLVGLGGVYAWHGMVKACMDASKPASWILPANTGSARAARR